MSQRPLIVDSRSTRTRLFESLSRRSRTVGEKHRRRLTIERLEDRITPTTFTVTNNGDSGLGTLRQAILDAQGDGTADTIVFSSSLAGETISLTSSDADTAFGPTALVVQNENITIEADPTLAGILIAGNQAERLFAVANNATLSIDNLTLTNGAAIGGAGGSVINGAGGGGGGGAGLGGAVFVGSGGTLNITGSTFVQNTATGGAGGNGDNSEYFVGTGGGSAGFAGGNGVGGVGSGGGGGVSGAGSSNSGNTGGSGGLNELGTSVGQDTNGTAGGGGGGADGSSENGTGGSGTALSSGGLGGGGGGSAVATAGAGGFGAGGGSTGDGQAANGGFGGGGGGAQDGGNGFGGFAAGDGADNINGGGGGGGAGMGGAIFMNSSSTVTIINSTFGYNTATGGAGGNNGGKSATSAGGAIFNLSGDLHIYDTTMWANSAGDGQGIYSLAYSGPTTTNYLSNDIIAQSNDDLLDVTLYPEGGNMVNSGIDDDIPNAKNFGPTYTNEPNLGPLANNGGPTETFLPNPGSIAIGNGSPSEVPASITTDQTNKSRLTNGSVDIGAAEVSDDFVAPTINSSPPGSFVVGSSQSYTITTTGFPNAALSESGTLPTGLSFVDNGNGTATLSGTPAAGTSGSYAWTITASNGTLPNATQSFNLDVDQAPQVTSVSSTTFTAGSPGTFTVTTAGFPDPALSESGVLPEGVTFVDNGNGTATLSGTPTFATDGSYDFTITAQNNGAGPDSTQNFALTVNESPVITSASSTTFTVGDSNSLTVTTSAGFPNPSLSEEGALPNGVSFVDNGNGTATLSGTPTAGSGGTYAITIDAQNGVGADATQSFSLTVNQAPTITSTSTTTFTTGTDGSYTVTTTGSPTDTLSESGALPSGVSFVDNGNGTATLTGTPADGTGGDYPITITADNGVDADATQNFTLVIWQSPRITSVSSTTFTTGTANFFSLSANGFPLPTFSLVGTLPQGLTLNNTIPGFGTITGTPSAGEGGVYNFTIKASNGVFPNGTQSFTLTIDDAAAITSGASTTFTTGTSGSFSVTTTGFPNAALSEIGALPNGVLFLANADGTASLVGTPAAGTSGTYPITIDAHNGVGVDALQSFLLTVNQAPAITSGPAVTFTTGTPGSFGVTTTGFPTAAVSETGALPSGVTFVDNGNGTASLQGIPTSGTQGSYLITITASNGVGTDFLQSFLLTVDQAPTITSSTSTTFTTGTAGSFSVTSTGLPLATLSETGALPGGVTFVDNHNGTAALSGTPAAGTGGTYAITIDAHNGVGTDALQPFLLTVNQAAMITSSAATTFTAGTIGSFTVTTAGFPTATVSESGALPTGVTFVANDNGSGSLSGVPFAGTGGSYPITITASNGVGTLATQSFVLTVNQAPAITSASSTTFTTGSSGLFTVTTTGVPTASLSETGALPSGVTFVANPNGTATLNGIPGSTAGGTYPITINANNGVGVAAFQSFLLVVNQAPTFTSATATTFTTGTSGSFVISTAGYPIASIVGSGVLPTGVTLVANLNGTATLQGTPAPGTGGSYPITFTADNGVGTEPTQSFVLTVNQPAVITSTPGATFVAGTAGSFTVTTTGVPTATISETGILPSGVTFVDNHNGTASLAGTPNSTVGGNFPVVITANNGSGAAASQSFVLVVNRAPTITSATSTNFASGIAGTFSVTTTGFPTSTLSEIGALPSGVTFVDNHNGTATLAGIPANGSGTSYPITITASNAVGLPATQAFTLNLTQSTTITLLHISTTSLVYGQPVTLSAFVYPSVTNLGAPTGTVTFFDNGVALPGGTVTLNGGIGTFSSSNLAVGNHSFTASYSGSPNFIASSGTLANNPVSVAKDATTSTLYTSTRDSVYGQPLTVSVNVEAATPGAGSPTGTVTFFDNSVSIATLPIVDGYAILNTSTLKGGSNSLTATYSADGNYLASTSPTYKGSTIVVSQAPTTTLIYTSAYPAITGQTEKFTATVGRSTAGSGAPTGVVSFYDGKTLMGAVSLSNGQASMSEVISGVGTHPISAVYSGDGNFLGGSSPTFAQPVVAATSLTTIGIQPVYGTNGKLLGLNLYGTVVVAAPGSAPVTGTVAFAMDNTIIGSAKLVNNVGVLFVPTTSPVGHKFVAGYAGTTSLQASRSAVVVYSGTAITSSARAFSALGIRKG